MNTETFDSALDALLKLDTGHLPQCHGLGATPKPPENRTQAAESEADAALDDFLGERTDTAPATDESLSLLISSAPLVWTETRRLTTYMQGCYFSATELEPDLWVLARDGNRLMNGAAPRYFKSVAELELGIQSSLGM